SLLFLPVLLSPSSTLFPTRRSSDLRRHGPGVERVPGALPVLLALGGDGSDGRSHRRSSADGRGEHDLPCGGGRARRAEVCSGCVLSATRLAAPVGRPCRSR